MVKYLMRTEQHHIKTSNPFYKIIDELCFKSKNLYNRALYIERALFFSENTFLDYYELYNYIKTEDVFKQLPSVLGQQVLRQVATNCSSFLKALKCYNADRSRFTGKPKIPKYKPKKGRFKLQFTEVTFRLKEGYLNFHKCLQGFKVKTKQDNILSVQIVPRFQRYVVEITYEKVVEILPETSLRFIAGIDLGINNFAAISIWNNNSRPLIISGKGLKSYNKYFNKQVSQLQSEAKLRHNRHTTKRIQSLYQKRNNYMQTWMHKASRATISYLIENQVRYIVIGYNKGWKQDSKLSKNVNQTFIQIPYLQYIKYLTDKAEEAGISVYLTEESYTSGTSFFDNEQPTKENYSRSRRVYRGLFKSNEGTLVNADINSAYQLIKKKFPDRQLNLSAGSKEQIHNKLEPIILKVA